MILIIYGNIPCSKVSDILNNAEISLTESGITWKRGIRILNQKSMMC